MIGFKPEPKPVCYLIRKHAPEKDFGNGATEVLVEVNLENKIREFAQCQYKG